MKAQSYLFGILVVVLSLAAVLGAAYLALTTTKIAEVVTPVAPPSPSPVILPTPATEPLPPETATTTQAIFPTLISPLQGTKIKSPLPVTGSAIGTWYFEGSFPVLLKDANGNIIAESHASAKGDWMSTSSVPFTALLSWTGTTTESGTLILKKDNPSGLPENDDEISFPVSF